MGLKLGIDFGTATTAAAVVLDDGRFIPELVRLDEESDFVDSLVWVTSPKRQTPLVVSRSINDRSPAALFSSAKAQFAEYWKLRIGAQDRSTDWSAWKEGFRERDMLLSYFKPELSDSPLPQYDRIVDSITTTFDPLSQSEDVSITYARRRIANPAPDSDDLVAATAAIVRSFVQAACLKYGERVDILVIGMPSLKQLGSGADYDRALQRRQEAVELSGVKGDYGSRAFRMEVFGEAEAAGYAIEPDTAASTARALLIDVGAGTTDIALVPYTRDSTGRFRAAEPLDSASVRFGGRNVNEILAHALLNNRVVRDAYEAMDERAWQIVLDRDIEQIKCALTSEEQQFLIRFHSVAAAPESGLIDNPKRDALKKGHYELMGLETPMLVEAFDVGLEPWADALGRLTSEIISRTGGMPPDTIELVGGALRFPPLRERLEYELYNCGFDAIPTRFQDENNEAQTAVARGLARRAALLAN
jgi:hypothetical protein